MILEIGSMYIHSILSNFIPPSSSIPQGGTVMVIIAADKETLENRHAFGHIRFHMDNKLNDSQDTYMSIALKNLSSEPSFDELLKIAKDAVLSVSDNLDDYFCLPVMSDTVEGFKQAVDFYAPPMFHLFSTKRLPGETREQVAARVKADPNAEWKRTTPMRSEKA